MARSIVPMSDMNRRMPEAGRIRTGVRSGNAMKAISNFRFTSLDRTAIDELAVLYGGTVSPWKGDKGVDQWEVITQANEIRVILPPSPLADTPVYEHWTKGGCQRRCDGTQCTMPAQGPDGWETDDVDCLCRLEDKLTCKPTVRLNVLLPDVKFSGTWRLQTHSWNAAQELPGMVDMVGELQSRGLPNALLALEPRVSVSNGQTRKFVVPVIRLAVSPEQMLAAPQLSAPQLMALPAPDDGEVAEAELLDPEVEALLYDFDVQCSDLFGIDNGPAYADAILRKLGADTDTATVDQLRHALGRLNEVRAGTLHLGINGKGDLVVGIPK